MTWKAIIWKRQKVLQSSPLRVILQQVTDSLLTITVSLGR